MFDFFNKFPFEGFRTYAMVILLAISAMWPEIQILLDAGSSMSNFEFVIAAGKIIAAFLALVFRRIGKEKA